MKHAIEKGNLLFQDQIGLPERSGVDKRSYVSGWECVEASTVHDLTREIKLAGWTLFRMAREIRTATFGFNREAMEKRAADRLIQAAKSQSCNCLQVSRINTTRWLGLLHVSIYARVHHIQHNIDCWSSHSWTRYSSKLLMEFLVTSK